MSEQVKMVCSECGSDEVVANAYVSWDKKAQAWVVDNVFEKGGYCDQCEGEARYTAVPIESPDTETDVIQMVDSDYALPREQMSVWVGVEGLSCYIHKTDEGVVVDLFRVGQENEDSIASTYAFWDEG